MVNCLEASSARQRGLTHFWGANFHSVPATTAGHANMMTKGGRKPGQQVATRGAATSQVST